MGKKEYVQANKDWLAEKAKEEGVAIDATQGRKTKAVLIMENSRVVLSALLPETIAGRVQSGREFSGEEEKSTGADDAECAGRNEE